MLGKRLHGWATILAVLFIPIAGTVMIAADPVRQGPQPLKPSEHGVGRYVADLACTDLSGRPHKLSEWKDRKAIVVCMTSTSCPLSKKYLPTLADLAKSYGQRGAQFVLVNPVATDKPNEEQTVAAALGSQALYIHDVEGKLAQAIGAKTTTDVVVLDAARTIVYHGAVDDQYGFGYSIEAPRRRYLADALEKVLIDRTPAIAATEAPGCALDQPRSTANEPVAVTYHNRISRIVARNCVECHRSGGVGPFELASPSHVSAHAPMIKQVVERGIMPPWFAAPSDPRQSSHWANDRSLSASDKADLLAWLDGGRPLGDERDGIAMPTYADGWLIGKPDAVFEFAKPVAIKATGTMPYQQVAVNTKLPEDMWVQAIEVRPGNRAVVHHVLVFVQQGDNRDDPSNDARAEGRGGYWAIYVPGNSTQIFPAGFAKRLPQGAKLRFQMHYTPNGTATEDRTQIGFVYAQAPPEHEVRVAGVVNMRISIPPGADHHEEVATLRLPLDVQVLGFLPHMHLRGKACRYEMIDAEGRGQSLLDVPRYDFNWQLLYSYFDPLPLARGSTIKFTAWYDNSDKNPANPDPAKTVRWGPQTYDEMQLGFVKYFVPAAKPGEPQSLRSAEGVVRGGASRPSGAIFAQLDADGNGKISKKELDAVGQFTPRLKDKPELIDGLFRLLDGNDDGFLDPTEFARLVERIRSTKAAETKD